MSTQNTIETYISHALRVKKSKTPEIDSRDKDRKEEEHNAIVQEYFYNLEVTEDYLKKEMTNKTLTTEICRQTINLLMDLRFKTACRLVDTGFTKSIQRTVGRHWEPNDAYYLFMVWEKTLKEIVLEKEIESILPLPLPHQP